MKINIGVICHGPTDFNSTNRDRFAAEGVNFIPLWIESQVLGVEFHGVITTRNSVMNPRYGNLLKICKQRRREPKQSTCLVKISECDHGYKGPNKHDVSCKLYCGMEREDYESSKS